MTKKYKNKTGKKQNSNGKRKFLKILLVILIIMLFFFGAITWYAHSKLSKVNYIKLENIQINEGVEEQLKGYRNIALLGVDARGDVYNNTRSDSIIIVSINQDTKEVKLTSIYRDTYVYIEGHGYDKITHAYAYGGPELAINTINKNFDLNISEFVAVNFEAVVDIIDSIGGVTIDVTSAEVTATNSNIDLAYRQNGISGKKLTTAGKQNLSGAQALAYARIRKLKGGDFQRTERTRNVLNATFEKVKTLSVSKLNSLADILLPKIYTNVTSTEILAEIPNIISYKVSSSEGWPYNVKDITLDRYYCVPVTLESNVKKLHEKLFGNTDYEVSSKVKEYSDGIIKKTGYK